MDGHLSRAASRAQARLKGEFPGLSLVVHCRGRMGHRRRGARPLQADIARGDIVIATMLFLDDHVRAVMPALTARRNDCDAMVCCMSAAEVVKLTRVGKFDMSGEALGAIAWLKKLRGSRNGSSPAARAK
jgi:magnesium chelatase subunit H